MSIGRIRPFSGHKRIEHMNASPVDNSLNLLGLQIKDEARVDLPTYADSIFFATFQSRNFSPASLSRG
jgi:hypothetical protein